MRVECYFFYFLTFDFEIKFTRSFKDSLERFHIAPHPVSPIGYTLYIQNQIQETDIVSVCVYVVVCYFITVILSFQECFCMGPFKIIFHSV